jgi:hypothetical protein
MTMLLICNFETIFLRKARDLERRKELFFHETATRQQKTLLAAEMTLPSFVGYEGSRDQVELTGCDRNAKG